MPAEADLAPSGSAGSSSVAPSAEGAGRGGLPPRCLQRLTREMRLIEEQRAKHLEEHSLELALSDPDGGDLRVWTLRLLSKGIDEACKLGKELRAHSIDAIVLEIWIPDAFPVEPPRLRVIQPCFNPGSFWVQAHGALCLEILTKQGWTPAMALPQLGVQVKSMMCQGNGSVSGIGFMGDPGPEGREKAWAVSERIESAHSDWNKFSMK